MQNSFFNFYLITLRHLLRRRVRLLLVRRLHLARRRLLVHRHVTVLTSCLLLEPRCRLLAQNCRLLVLHHRPLALLTRLRRLGMS